MNCPHCNGQIKEFKNPTPTVDIIVEIGDGIVLIERKYPPFGWAIPGGFVDYGESYEAAAVREAKEETGLDVQLKRQFHTYSDPSRDARQHTASTVFIATANGIPVGRDDAIQAKIFLKQNLPVLVFDHAKILADYYKGREKG